MGRGVARPSRRRAGGAPASAIRVIALTLGCAIAFVGDAYAAKQTPPTRDAAKAATASNTAGATAPAERDGADNDAETAATKPVQPPDRWSAAEQQAAMKACIRTLAQVRADVSAVTPVRKGRCGSAAMITVSSIETDEARVRFMPPVELTCDMVPAIGRWLQDSVQPAAAKAFGGPVRALRGVGGYACRNRNGAKRGRLSEHAFGNALDIATFVVGGRGVRQPRKQGRGAAGTRVTRARRISVLRDWGPTRRDVQPDVVEDRKRDMPSASSAAQLHGTAQALERGETAGAETAIPLPELRETALGLVVPVRNPNRVTPGRYRREIRERSVVVPVSVARSRTVTGAVRSQRATRRVVAKPAATPAQRALPRRQKKTAPAKGVGARSTAALAPKSRFLKRIHADACRYFGTVLGPEANEAHRDHFHLDLAPRRRSNYCR
ncbi:MAG: extensin family protein [Pseudomonadota bacterium]